MHDQTNAREEFRVLPLVQPVPHCNPIDTAAVRCLCAAGLSECPVEDRCVSWLLLLGVLPDDPFQWADRRQAHLAVYRACVAECELTEWHRSYFPPLIQHSCLPVKENHIMWAIHTDVVRTGRHIFFLPPEEALPGAPDGIESRYAIHMRRIERILYVFAHLNRDLSYMQGFNELCVPLYYVNHEARQYLGGDPDEVEALSFACFNQLITKTDIRSFYTTGDSSSVVDAKMREFMALMEMHLPDMHKVLRKLGISPLDFCVPWFNLLYTQKYQLPVVLMIWDSLFAHFDDLMKYFAYIVIVHLERIKDELFERDFGATLLLLQGARADNVLGVLRKAHVLYEADRRKMNARS
jgi:hypothetical protein